MSPNCINIEFRLRCVSNYSISSGMCQNMEFRFRCVSNYKEAACKSRFSLFSDCALIVHKSLLRFTFAFTVSLLLPILLLVLWHAALERINTLLTYPAPRCILLEVEHSTMEIAINFF